MGNNLWIIFFREDLIAYLGKMLLNQSCFHKYLLIYFLMIKVQWLEKVIFLFKWTNILNNLVWFSIFLLYKPSLHFLLEKKCWWRGLRHANLLYVRFVCSRPHPFTKHIGFKDLGGNSSVAFFSNIQWPQVGFCVLTPTFPRPKQTLHPIPTLLSPVHLLITTKMSQVIQEN